MEHVNFNQLTSTPFVFEKNGQIMNKTKITYMMWQHADQLALQAVITCTWHYKMLLIVVGAELFDMHWN
jgi:hypothetical protein